MLERFVSCTTGSLECVVFTHSELFFVGFLVFMAGFACAFTLMMWAQAGREAILHQQQQQQRQRQAAQVEAARRAAREEFVAALRQPSAVLHPDQ